MDGAKLRPLGNNVLVRVAKAEETTPGGIIVPDAVKERPLKGEVLAVGPGHWHDGTFTEIVGVHPGDVVLFQRYAGIIIGGQGSDLLLLPAVDLLAVEEK